MKRNRWYRKGYQDGSAGTWTFKSGLSARQALYYGAGKEEGLADRKRQIGYMRREWHEDIKSEVYKLRSELRAELFPNDAPVDVMVLISELETCMNGATYEAWRQATTNALRWFRDIDHNIELYLSEKAEREFLDRQSGEPKVGEEWAFRRKDGRVVTVQFLTDGTIRHAITPVDNDHAE